MSQKIKIRKISGDKTFEMCPFYTASEVEQKKFIDDVYNTMIIIGMAETDKFLYDRCKSFIKMCSTMFPVLPDGYSKFILWTNDGIHSAPRKEDNALLDTPEYSDCISLLTSPAFILLWELFPIMVDNIVFLPVHPTYKNPDGSIISIGNYLTRLGPQLYKGSDVIRIPLLSKLYADLIPLDRDALMIEFGQHIRPHTAKITAERYFLRVEFVQLLSNILKYNLARLGKIDEYLGALRGSTGLDGDIVPISYKDINTGIPVSLALNYDIMNALNCALEIKGMLLLDDEIKDIIKFIVREKSIVCSAATGSKINNFSKYMLDFGKKYGISDDNILDILNKYKFNSIIRDEEFTSIGSTPKAPIFATLNDTLGVSQITSSRSRILSGTSGTPSVVKDTTTRRCMATIQKRSPYGRDAVL